MALETISKKDLTHFDAAGNAHMVDVGSKADTARKAVAAGTITMSTDAYKLVQSGDMSKGDVLGVARVAGIMGAKKTSDLIPLTHPLAINNVSIDYEFNDSQNSIEILSSVGTTGKTGVEMEALTAVSITALTIYDMCKSIDKAMVIDNIRLLSKKGGKSGTYHREKE